MDVRIYKPSKNAMQSGRGNTDDWVLEYKSNGKRDIDPLMGWTSSKDTQNQIRIPFSTCESAVDFAKQKNWDYTIAAEHKRKIKPKNYSDNFKYIPPQKQKKT